MQDQVADRVRLFVGTPPDLLVVQSVETGADLLGQMDHEPRPGDVQKGAVNRPFHR